MAAQSGALRNPASAPLAGEAIGLLASLDISPGAHYCCFTLIIAMTIDQK